MGEVTNAELERKLDLVLQKIDGLEQRVSKLENRDLQIEEEIEKVSAMARTANSESILSLPQNEEEKNLSFLSFDYSSNSMK